MNAFRRNVLKGAAGASAVAVAVAAGLLKPTQAMAAWNVPVEVASSIAGITSIAILAEKNALPLVGNFGMSGGAEGFISTRIKMGQTSLIRAVVSAGGKTFTTAKEVKVTIGGCGG